MASMTSKSDFSPVLLRAPRSNDESKHRALLERPIPRMYFEDWYNGILPFVGTEKQPFNVEVFPTEARERFSILISGTRRRGRPLEEAIYDLFRDITQLIILHGGAAYEMTGDPQENGRISLRKVDFEGLQIRGSQVEQAFFDKQQNCLKTVSISEDRVFLVKEPSWIEGGKGFEYMIMNLSKYGDREFTPTKHFNSRPDAPPSYFDYEVFRRKQEYHLLNLTKSSGWQSRSTFADSITEHYWMHRFLRQRISHVRLREYILDCLNRDLLPKLRKLNLTVIDRVEITGTPNSSDLAALLTKMSCGEIGFKEAMDQSGRYS